LHVAEDHIIQTGGNLTKPLSRGILMRIWRKLFSREGSKMGPFEPKSRLDSLQFDASEWILIWLALNNQSPVRGKTAFVKELFITGKEKVPSIDQTFQFFGHRFGPYSKVFERNLSSLVSSEMMTETPNNESRGLDTDTPIRLDYTLTEKGVAYANELIEKIPPFERNVLGNWKRVLSKMGLWGLLRYVYSNYPEYTMSSEILLELES